MPLLPLMLRVILGIQQFLVCSGKSTPKRELRGAGASFPNEVYQSWMVSYGASRVEHVDLTMTYEAVGSGNGKKRIQALDGENIVDYAGSDSWLSELEVQETPDLVAFPTMAGAITVAYNLPEAGDIRLILTMEQVVGIYNGTYRFWNDSTFTELNPGVQFPGERILVLARADKSGTTEIFTRSLSHASAGWEAEHGFFNQGAEQSHWEPEVVKYFAFQNRGMSGLLLSFKYSIGYLSVSDAEASDVPYANLVNHYGTIVVANVSAVQETMDASLVETRGKLMEHLTSHVGLNGYPIADYTYLIVRMSSMEDCNSAIELLRYIDWFLSDDVAMDACVSRYMVPITASMAAQIRRAVLEKLTCEKRFIWPVAKREIDSENRPKKSSPLIYVLVSGALVLGILLVLSVYFVHRYIQYQRLLMRDEWNIPIEEIMFYHSEVSSKTGRARLVMWPSLTSLTNIEDLDEGYDMLKHILQWPGKWGGITVGLRLLEVKSNQSIDRKTKIGLLWMKDAVNHSNVLKFYGLTQVEKNHYVVSDYCSRGSLHDLLHDPKHNINNDFKMSLSLDLASGLFYLHSKGIVHGNLRSSCCLLDFKWMLKICDWEYVRLYEHLAKKKNPLLLLRKGEDEVDKDTAAFLDFWTAPEILKSDFDMRPSTSCDVYSYGIILQEIFTRNDPYVEYVDSVMPSELIKNIINNNLRPQHDTDTPGKIRHLMDCTWYEEPEKRPSVEQILKTLRNCYSFKKTIIDSVMESTEQYTSDLESRLEVARLQIENLQGRLSCVHRKMIPMELCGTNNTPREQGDTSSGCSEILPGGKNILDQAPALFHQLPIKEQGVKKEVVVIYIRHVAAHNNPQQALQKPYVDIMDKIDRNLDELVQKHNLFRSDDVSGASILVAGLGSLPNVSMMSLTQDFLTMNNRLKPERSLLRQHSGIQTGIHKGFISVHVLQNDFPKCYFFGDAVFTAQNLAQQSEPGRVLVSKAFKESIKAGVVRFTVKDLKFLVNGCEEDAFWMSLPVQTKNQGERHKVHPCNFEPAHLLYV